MKNFLLFIALVFAGYSFAEKVTMTCPSISCSSCEGKITATLSKMEGVDKESIKVDIEKKTVSFDYKTADKSKNDDRAKLSEKLTKEMKELGYPIAGDLAWAEDETKKKK